jgi:uracil-DNA glycosylase
MKTTFTALNQIIINCRRCSRLVYFRENAPIRKEFAQETYWRRPVPGFGDPKAWLLIIGLAPAAQGGNRTGRIFTGDATARFLMEALFRTGFASQATSLARTDGLQLFGCYLTAAVKCVPPENLPKGEEFRNCAPYFENEFFLLPNLRAILALGKGAFDTALRFVRKASQLPLKEARFSHGSSFETAGWPTLYGSYHCSPQNTNTGRLTEVMFCDLLERIKSKHCY